MIPQLKHLDHHEKLKDLNLFSLGKRRLRGDLIETYKICNDLDKIDSDISFTLNQSNTRGHNFKLYKHKVRVDARKNFFSQRVDPWNKLPSDAVEANNPNAFKCKIDRFFEANGII